ncbi:P-loop containing nucleoside triphosphate hydrolase protein [Melanomma pulvis-pyrius CBS 109.77]|uniref:P-loop containing nucleoside triphosphate hydrolase protein n=1 Tax=Melanomma pulvis-pyrius CBS 109.77 TaxID=1314802 RepID=A0A6A6XJ13_9PLEO|nr:P-loop containing nucleoside triphosphate hydrolase protein [Melanomma pulvis-pyrius CBS 109.77]
MSDGNTPKPTFNVVFPLRERDLKSQWSALGYVASELKAASPSSNSPRSAHEELSCWAANIIVTASFSAQQANGTDQILEKEEQAPNDWIRRMLFPTEADGVVQMKLRTIPFRRGLFDHNMNYEQLQVVNSVCENEYGVLPFLISGPPGTGKTKTLVELALNLLNSTEIGHILICAPSDSAADTLVQRLKQHLTPNQLLRFNGPTRGDNEVPQGLLSYCYMKSEMFDLPPFAEFMAYNVVVTSTRDSSILADARLTNTDLFIVETRIRSAFHPESKHATPTLHWGALLIDEAAQATEVDALPALSVVMPPSTYPKSMPQPRLVMAGDQNQLGPKTASRNPEYSTSLFERLFNRPIYKNHPLSRSHARPSASPPVMTAKMLPMLRPPFTNLNRNYRSHPAILSVPSSLFYNDTLIPEATMSPSPLQTSPLWLGRKWPVLYIAHTGPDEIERDGGGWYNVSEAQRACNLAARLVTESGVKQTDICIMSPFSAQVRILRRMMRSHVYGDGAGMRDVNIGPVEAFQGLESRVVIICTTRTRDRFLDQDTKRGLGIVHQKRKINVALTRAKEALFVIGSPEVLGRDEHWRAFLAFCWRNGLVSKGGVVWDGSKDAHAESKIGVLERALLVKAEREEQGRENERVLGAGHAPRGLGVREDESWAEMLRAALEEFTDEEDAQDNDHDENEEGGYDDDDDDDKSMDDIAGSNSDSNGDDGVIQFVGKISGKKLTLRDGSSFAL